MKQLFYYVAVTGFVLLGTASAQDFQNLDFEQATIVPFGGGTDPSLVQASRALPDWTVYIGSSSVNYVVYDTVTLGSPDVSVQDSLSAFPPLQGSYSVIVQHSTGGTPTSAGIGQTGQIPLDAASISFDAANYQNLSVTFAGIPLSLVRLGDTSQYSVLGADISAYSSQTGELLFTDTSGGSELLTLDNIQFSTLSIPESRDVVILMLGGLLFMVRHVRTLKR